VGLTLDYGRVASEVDGIEAVFAQLAARGVVFDSTTCQDWTRLT
jgi:hypothetical protein